MRSTCMDGWRRSEIFKITEVQDERVFNIGSGYDHIAGNLYVSYASQTEKFTGISKIEVIVLAAAEFAFFRMWRNDIREEVPYLLSIMRYVMLAFMTVFCVEDYREQLVPNRVLLFLLVLFPDYSWEVMEFTIWIRF